MFLVKKNLSFQLSRFIESICIYPPAKSTGFQSVKSFPAGYSYIILNPYKKFTIVTESEIVSSNAFLVGNGNQTFDITLPGKGHSAVIRFFPWFNGNPLGLSTLEITGGIISLTDLNKHLTNNLLNWLPDFIDNKAALHSLEEILSNYLKNKYIPDSRVIHLVKSLVSSSNYFNQNEISHELNISSRRLQQLCVNDIGLPFSHFKNIVKVNRFMKNVISSNGRDDRFLYSDDYFDQSHFIKYVKKYTGFTPVKLKEFILSSPDPRAYLASNLLSLKI